jgi:CRISPR-associated protein Csb2
LKQYHPTEIKFSKGANDAEVRRAVTSLSEDNYRAVPHDDPLFWCWETVELEALQTQLLDQLLERILYFGRAESFSRLRLVAALPSGVELNCRLAGRDAGAMTPVLAHSPAQPFEIASLLAASDQKELANRSIPPGTNWFYARLPKHPVIAHPAMHRAEHEGHNYNYMQFAVGGRVFPSLHHWVKITERFRGRVIRSWIEANAPAARGRYDMLTLEQKDRLALITGKDRHGQPVRGHQHAYFFLWPDENDSPKRLIIWRATPFTRAEVEALQDASQHKIAWEDGLPEWWLRVVPLPQETPVPASFHKHAKVWESVTPFVIPAERRRFRKNGRERSGESVEKLLGKLLLTESKPLPERILVLEGGRDAAWVRLHETRNRRMLKADTRTAWARPGFRIRMEFSKPVAGPFALGDSCHFGLGLFMAKDEGSR